jgi:hypothetical protein
VAVNPADVEEALWQQVARARTDGFAEARRRRLVVGRDRRAVLRDVSELFAAEPGTEAERAARTRVDAWAAGSAPSSAPSDLFYARLYLGLLAEARGDAQAARAAIESALRTQYASASADYMIAAARVHAAQRGWGVTSADAVPVTPKAQGV